MHVDTRDASYQWDKVSKFFQRRRRSRNGAVRACLGGNNEIPSRGENPDGDRSSPYS